MCSNHLHDTHRYLTQTEFVAMCGACRADIFMGSESGSCFWTTHPLGRVENAGDYQVQVMVSINIFILSDFNTNPPFIKLRKLLIK